MGNSAWVVNDGSELLDPSGSFQKDELWIGHHTTRPAVPLGIFTRRFVAHIFNTSFGDKRTWIEMYDFFHILATW